MPNDGMTLWDSRDTSLTGVFNQAVEIDRGTMEQRFGGDSKGAHRETNYSTKNRSCGVWDG